MSVSAVLPHIAPAVTFTVGYAAAVINERRWSRAETSDESSSETWTSAETSAEVIELKQDPATGAWQ